MLPGRGRHGAGAGRWWGRVGVVAPHWPDHERGAVPPVGLGTAVVSELPPRAHLAGRSRGWWSRRLVVRPVGTGDPRPWHPRGYGSRPHPAEPDRPASRTGQARVRRDRDRYRRAV